MKKFKRFSKAGTVGLCLVIGFSVFLTTSYLTSDEMISESLVPDWMLHSNTEESKWVKVELPLILGDGYPGAGKSGILHAGVYPAQRSPDDVYNSNLSESNFYAYTEVNNSHAGDNVPYDTMFDIVFKVRWNTTHAYNDTSSSWDLSLVYGNITCPGLSISADTAMNESEIGSGVDFIWVYYYIQDVDGGDWDGSGLTVWRGQNVTQTLGEFWAYY